MILKACLNRLPGYRLGTIVPIYPIEKGVYVSLSKSNMLRCRIKLYFKFIREIKGFLSISLVFLCIMVFDCQGFITTQFVFADQIKVTKFAILVSKRIKPYVEASEGANETLLKSNIQSETFYLDNYEEKYDNLHKKLIGESFNCFIAVGPEAARFLWNTYPEDDVLKVFTMILHPEKVLHLPESICGVSLQIPAEQQIRIYKESLPTLNTLGLLYDPVYNEAFAKHAAVIAESEGLTFIPLPISSKKDIPEILEKRWVGLDGLWLIPDRTVITESIIKYIIKQALVNRVPVIGYNRFFYDSGAALSLLLNYREIGSQGARMAIGITVDRPCQTVVPVFKVLLNKHLLEKLGVPYVASPNESYEKIEAVQ